MSAEWTFRKIKKSTSYALSKFSCVHPITLSRYSIIQQLMKLIVTILLLITNSVIFAQSIDHWETAIYNDDIWRYRIGNSEPPADWMQTDFNDMQWAIGTGGFGYGDGDDNTQIPNTTSVYIRRTFELIDTAAIQMAILHSDYDDAFVTYLNGVEITRRNIGIIGTPPAYDDTADDYREAEWYQGGVPEAFTLYGISLKNLMQEGTNTLAIQVHNHDINSSDMSANFFFSVGISDTSMNYGNTPNWFYTPLAISSNLPLIVINTTETDEIYDEPRVSAHMGIIDNGQGQTNSIFDDFTDYNGRIAIEIRGASSQTFPKKNYGFETQLEDGENNNVSLLGMPKENDWILHGPYADKSLLRNVVAYHLAKTTGHYAPRTRLCELLVNGDYRGVYILTERIKQDNNRVDIANLKPEDIEGDELTGGYILQIDRDNEYIPNDGWYSGFQPWKFYAFDSPDYDVIQPEQRNYIQNYITDFEEMMNAPNYEENYRDYVDVDSWVDYFLVTEIGKHIDAYKLSFFMYKKKDSNGGKLYFGPIWDFNLAFGNFDFACPPQPAGWAYQFSDFCDDWQAFWVEELAETPQVSHQIDCRWAEMRAGAWHTDTLMQLIDENVEILSEAQVRNFERWQVLGTYVWPNDYVGQTYEEEVDFLKNWLTQRLDWMDANMLGNCDFFVANENIFPVQKLNIYPNPIDNYLFVEFKNNNSINTQFELYDIKGKHIDTYSISKSFNKIDLQNIPQGMYFYSVIQDNVRTKVGKIIKE